MNKFAAVSLAVLLTAATLPLSAGAAAHNERNPQEQQFRQQQQENRSAQEQQLRQQEEQARAAQLQAQSQQRAQMQQAERQQQAEVRQEHQVQQNEQKVQQQAQQQQLRQERQQQAQFKNQEIQQQQQQQAQTKEQQRQYRGWERNMANHEQAALNAEQTSNWFPQGNVLRAEQPRALTMPIIPLKQALPMPIVNQQLTSALEREHVQQMINNYNAHLQAIELANAPAEMAALQQQEMAAYTNNYLANLQGQQIAITEANTFVNPVPVYQYPYWYQPQPGWQFSNGFTIGNVVRAGLDWLGFGWHPYFGQTPQGFICATNYVPTPYTYYPGYGLWRDAGVSNWAPVGPPPNYSGPVSVMVVEPRNVTVSNNYNGWSHQNYINVPYLYDAFFYPRYDRWGYVNHNGYFVWLNV